MRSIFKYFSVILLSLQFSVFASSIANAQQQELNIVATIKPVHGLVSLITKDIHTPELLITNPMAGHHFTLKPSMMKNLEAADIVFWIGPNQEASLADAFDYLASSYNIHVSTLSKTDDLLLYSMRETDHNQEIDENKNNSQELNDLTTDQHVWLHFDNVKKILIQISADLTDIDHENASKYEANLTSALELISELERGLSSASKDFAGLRYGVLHDGFQYFEKQFNIQEPLIAEARIGLGLSAGEMMRLQQEFKNYPISCFIVEPAMKTAPMVQIAKRNGAKILLIDPIGSSFDAGPTHFSQLMRSVFNEFQKCL